MHAERSVTVVIPSTALRERVDLLMRAVQSVREQQGVRAVPLVVLNGAHCAPEVEGILRALPGTRVLVRAEGGLPGALRAGRELVDTTWFATLDDDDLLLPGALMARVRALEERPSIDVVVTNGIVRCGDEDTLHMSPNVQIEQNPMRALLAHNWLLPGCWLARTERVSPSLFEGMPKYRECTFLALRIASQYTMHWMQEPTVIRYMDSPRAESKSREYLFGQVDALNSLSELKLPSYMQRLLRTRIAAAMHENADALLVEGDVDEGWRWHWQSLCAYRGVRYLPFTRHLVAASIRRTMSRLALRGTL